MTRIALIHATPVAVEPINEAFARIWPEADLANLLEDSLSRDRKARPLTPQMFARFQRLTDYGVSIGARLVLFTCSAFGEAIDAAAAAAPVPVLKPNEAMFEEAFAHGAHIGMVATFEPAIAGMEAEFAEAAARLKPGATITTRLAPGAMDALRAGDTVRHNALVAAEAAGLSACEAIMLAHFSTSRALQSIQAVVKTPVLSSPDAAARKVRRLAA